MRSWSTLRMSIHPMGARDCVLLSPPLFCLACSHRANSTLPRARSPRHAYAVEIEPKEIHALRGRVEYMCQRSRYSFAHALWTESGLCPFVNLLTHTIRRAASVLCTTAAWKRTSGSDHHPPADSLPGDPSPLPLPAHRPKAALCRRMRSSLAWTLASPRSNRSC